MSISRPPAAALAAMETDDVVLVFLVVVAVVFPVTLPVPDDPEAEPEPDASAVPDAEPDPDAVSEATELVFELSLADAEADASLAVVFAADDAEAVSLADVVAEERSKSQFKPCE